MKHEETSISQQIDNTGYSHKIEKVREHSPLIELFTVFILGVFLLGFSLIFLRASLIFANSCAPTVEVRR